MKRNTVYKGSAAHQIIQLTDLTLETRSILHLYPVRSLYNIETKKR